MSMSTKIEDLPGPIPNEIIDDLHDIQNNIRQQKDIETKNEEELLRKNTIQNRQTTPNPEIYKQAKVNSNVQMNIKKRVKFEDENGEDDDDMDFISFVKNQISEDNLLLLVVLILSSRSDFDIYLRSLPMVGNYVNNSEWLSIIVRCVILLIIYLVTRQYILPKIKV